MKYRNTVLTCRQSCRSPHGERGLKLYGAEIVTEYAESLPARGAWVEIKIKWRPAGASESLPARGAWVEMPHIHKFNAAS